MTRCCGYYGWPGRSAAGCCSPSRREPRPTGCGIALLAVSGFMLARASEHPSIIAISAAVVAVRALSVGRGTFRYGERLASHDVAFRVLADVRVSIYRRLERLAPAGLRAFRSGDLLARLISDVDATQDLFIRAIAPPLTALLAGGGAVILCLLLLGPAGGVLAAGLVTARRDGAAAGRTPGPGGEQAHGSGPRRAFRGPDRPGRRCRRPARVRGAGHRSGGGRRARPLPHPARPQVRLRGGPGRRAHRRHHRPDAVGRAAARRGRGRGWRAHPGDTGGAGPHGTGRVRRGNCPSLGGRADGPGTRQRGPGKRSPGRSRTR